MENTLNSHLTPEQLLQPVLTIERDAALAILEVYTSSFVIEHKDDASPLTAADLAAHRIICRDLAKLTPHLPILSEESASIPWPQRKTWDCYWLVDPLDGTREFIKRNGEFTVNIALIMNHQPVLGVVYVPTTDTGYYASTDTGAFKIINGSTAQVISTRRTVADQLIVAGSRSHGSEVQKQFFESLGPNIQTVIVGSSLKHCLVAEGSIDIYPRFGPTSEWDTAAAQCIVERAGGKVTDMQFRPLLYNTKESLLNPDFLVIADRQFDWQTSLAKFI